MTDAGTNIDQDNQDDSAADADEYVPPHVPQGFSIHDASSASWVVRKIVEARKYGERVRVWAAAETRRAENEERFFLQRYGPQLEAWAREQLRDTRSRRRSIALPSGTIGFRTAATRLVIADERALLDWCRGNLQTALAVEVKASGAEAHCLLDWQRNHCPAATATASVTKSILDEHFRTTGECPAGTQCATGEKFFVK